MPLINIWFSPTRSPLEAKLKNLPISCMSKSSAPRISPIVVFIDVLIWRTYLLFKEWTYVQTLRLVWKSNETREGRIFIWDAVTCLGGKTGGYNHDGTFGHNDLFSEFEFYMPQSLRLIVMPYDKVKKKNKKGDDVIGGFYKPMDEWNIWGLLVWLRNCPPPNVWDAFKGIEIVFQIDLKGHLLAYWYMKELSMVIVSWNLLD